MSINEAIIFKITFYLEKLISLFFSIFQSKAQKAKTQKQDAKSKLQKEKGKGDKYSLVKRNSVSVNFVNHRGS